MAKLPETITESPTVLAIYAAYQKKQSEYFARRLGASQAGKECDRSLWYDFRWAGKETFNGRMLRLFQRGNLEEHVFVDDLQKIGCEVMSVDPETGNQFEYIAISGHFVVKLDGAALGIPEAPKTWHACEFKTHSAKSFAKLKKDGVQKAKPEHYVQLMLGMHLGGLERGLYLAVNKDTDDLHAERVRYDKAEAEKFIARIEAIIKAKTAPPRISEDRTAFSCQYCCHNARCFGSTPLEPAVPVKVSCRSCVHSTPVIEEDGTGRWVCEKHGKTISHNEQLKACEDHLFIPDFITFAESIDAGKDENGDWILYKNPDGETWANTKQAGGYRSHELTVLPFPVVGVAGTEETGMSVEDLKREMGGVVTEVG